MFSHSDKFGKAEAFGVNPVAVLKIDYHIVRKATKIN